MFVTDPVSVTVKPGTEATFTVEVAGDPAPTVTWQRMLPVTGEAGGAGGAGALNVASPVQALDGGTWEAVTAGVAADELTLTVTGTDTLNGAMYRAIANNTHGEAVSQAATLTVTEGAAANASPNADGNADGGPWGELEVTGSGGFAVILWLSVLLVLAGAGTITWGVRQHSRR